MEAVCWGLILEATYFRLLAKGRAARRFVICPAVLYPVIWSLGIVLRIHECAYREMTEGVWAGSAVPSHCYGLFHRSGGRFHSWSLIDQTLRIRAFCGSKSAVPRAARLTVSIAAEPDWHERAIAAEK